MSQFLYQPVQFLMTISFTFQDIIDLTCNSDVLAYVTSSDDVIDLTSLEEDASHETFQQLIKCNIGSLSDGGSDPESEGTISSPMKDESCSSKDLEFDIESSECSFRSANSSICSIESTTDLRQPDDADLPSKSNLKPHSVNSSNLQASHNQDDRSVHSDIGTQVQHITSSTPIVSPAMQKDTEDTLCSPAIVINKSLLYKFRHFRKPPISHLLPPTLRCDQVIAISYTVQCLCLQSVTRNLVQKCKKFYILLPQVPDFYGRNSFMQ